MGLMKEMLVRFVELVYPGDYRAANLLFQNIINVPVEEGRQRPPLLTLVDYRETYERTNLVPLISETDIFNLVEAHR